MRLIRFVDDDGGVHFGEDQGDGTALIVLDPRGMLGVPTTAARRAVLRGRRALVADDDENMRELLATVLESVGCACTVCANGAEAMTALEREPLDLVVSDIVMPHRNGYEIFAAARKRDEHMPVVLVTGFGYDPNHSLVRASEEGLASVLYKPFTPQQLLDEVDEAIRLALISPADALVRTDERRLVRRLLAPLDPTNVICVGRNYPSGDGAVVPSGDDDLEVFMKPTSAVAAPGEAIRIPDCGGADPQVGAEGELAVIIGSIAQNVSAEHAMNHVLGYTAANDVTARRWQSRRGPTAWMRGKGFDTFCPLGPAIVTADEIAPGRGLELATEVNGTVLRHGSTGTMLRTVPELLRVLSRSITLRPGTVILTGAPPTDAAAPAPHLDPGDVVTVELEGIGRLENPVEAAEAMR